MKSELLVSPVSRNPRKLVLPSPFFLLGLVVFLFLFWAWSAWRFGVCVWFGGRAFVACAGCFSAVSGRLG